MAKITLMNIRQSFVGRDTGGSGKESPLSVGRLRVGQRYARSEICATLWTRTRKRIWSLFSAFSFSFVLLLAGCGRKEPENIMGPPTTNHARMEEVEPALSEGDAAMLKGAVGPKKPETDADLAWDELSNSLQPPHEPPEWQLKEPTKEEMAAFEKSNGLVAATMADKMKGFYTRFPKHEQAAEGHHAEQARGQFTVGITITGKRGSLPISPETVAVNAKTARANADQRRSFAIREDRDVGPNIPSADVRHLVCKAPFFT